MTLRTALVTCVIVIFIAVICASSQNDNIHQTDDMKVREKRHMRQQGMRHMGHQGMMRHMRQQGMRHIRHEGMMNGMMNRNRDNMDMDRNSMGDRRGRRRHGGCCSHGNRDNDDREERSHRMHHHNGDHDGHHDSRRHHGRHNHHREHSHESINRTSMHRDRHHHYHGRHHHHRDDSHESINRTRTHRDRHHHHGNDGHGCGHGRNHDHFHGQLDPNTGLPQISPRAQRKVMFLTTSINRFTSDLHADVGLSSADLAYSPYAIYQALTMVYMGSRGHTAFELRRVLHLIGMGRHIRYPVFQQNLLLNYLYNATLKLANGFFVTSDALVSHGFIHRLGSNYQTNVSWIDGDNPNGTEDLINDWVSAQTENLVPQAIRPLALAQRSSVVLVNAVYFTAQWKIPFMPRRTRRQMFRKSAHLQVLVQMMEVQNQFKIGQVPGIPAQVLELPYEGDRFSMFVILPNDVEGLASIEENLSPDFLGVTLDTVAPSPVRVYLPKFSLDTFLDLKTNLQDLGMSKAFDPGFAEFSRIADNNLYISDFFHRTIVNITETHGDTFGETGLFVDESVTSAPAVEYRCDHPFLFIIRDNVSKVNLIVGKYSGGGRREEGF